MKTKGETGEYLDTNSPYGNRKDADNKQQWIVDEEAAKVVKRIFALCLDGYGQEQELWEKLLRLNEEITKQEKQAENIDRFIGKVRKYLNLDN